MPPSSELNESVDRHHASIKRVKPMPPALLLTRVSAYLNDTIGEIPPVHNMITEFPGTALVLAEMLVTAPLLCGTLWCHPRFVARRAWVPCPL